MVNSPQTFESTDMMNSEPNPEQKEWQFTGKHMLICMLCFFGVIITVNLTMAVIANKSWTGLVVQNSYVASQKFNDEIASQKALEAKGWQGELTYSPGQISYNFVGKNQTALSGFNVELTIGRPSSEQQDRTILLKEIKSGLYQVDHQLEPGIWAIKLIAKNRDGHQFQQQYRLHIRP